MHSDKFESCFDDFLDVREFEDAEEALFQLVRTAFSAGWIAAGGDPPDMCHMMDQTKYNKVIPFSLKRCGGKLSDK